MITLDLSHLFKTNPNSTKVPKIVFDWVIEHEKQFSEIEYQITFKQYSSEEEKKLCLNYEKIYVPIFMCFRRVLFPLNAGIWTVRIIGDERIVAKAIGRLGTLKEREPRIQLIPSENKVLSMGCTRLAPISSKDEEMIDIRCDRNINDEWNFRGTGQEFLDEKVKPLLN